MAKKTLTPEALEKKQKKIQKEIARLEKELQYHQNQQGENKDDKDIDIEIIIPEEE